MELTTPGADGPGLTVTVVEESTGWSVRLVGELDLATRQLLTDAVDRVPREPRPVVLDLAGLTFCDVLGVRALLHAHTMLAESGHATAYRSAPRSLIRLVVLLGLDPDCFADAPAGGPGIADVVLPQQRMPRGRRMLARVLGRG